MNATCARCGQGFSRADDEAWKRLCFPCWKETKGTHQRSECPPPPRPVVAPIPDDMLRRLIRLCHPDRHAGSEGATIATQWLLAQRQR